MRRDSNRGYFDIFGTSNVRNFQGDHRSLLFRRSSSHDHTKLFVRFEDLLKEIMSRAEGSSADEMARSSLHILCHRLRHRSISKRVGWRVFVDLLLRPCCHRPFSHLPSAAGHVIS